MDYGDFSFFACVVLISFIPILIGAAQLRKKYDSVKHKYDKMKETHEQLKSDVKLLQQENFYLKQLLNKNTDSVK